MSRQLSALLEDLRARCDTGGKPAVVAHLKALNLSPIAVLELTRLADDGLGIQLEEFGQMLEDERLKSDRPSLELAERVLASASLART